jgi:hypothetical protein
MNKSEASQSVPAGKQIRYIRRESELKVFKLRSISPAIINTYFKKDLKAKYPTTCNCSISLPLSSVGNLLKQFKVSFVVEFEL